MKVLLLSKNAITWYEVAVIIVLVVVLIVLKKKYTEMKKRREIAEMNERNEQLMNALKNPDSEKNWSKQPKPHEVQYIPKTENNKKSASDMQIEIEVHTEMSVQHYLFDLDKMVTIGHSEKNTLPLNDQTISEYSCAIAMKEKAVYVKNEDQSKPICIQRGKNKSLIINQYERIQNKDILILGNTELHISLYKN